ncbi:DUF1064 domain-containing protein [Clostridiales Family XIII bacterium ASD5510]|uniref:DUF1064 domain-containing protein n=1 Tax=Hominibacterium faecale TaxID=2839743 RepID=A0A9J6QYC2_9FIRM|nr:DUF1064 domain-containing protein [Hominibacterium faecale]MCU7380487.1 DUF1064 domain-containing protein [Hominibacterium faecale]
MNIDSLNDLPEKYRKQAEIKLGKIVGTVEIPELSKKSKAKKYRNQQVETDGIHFDSKKEATRYKVLMDRLKKGEISDLRLQAGFTLVEGFTAPTGDKIRPIRYIADFTYYDSEGNYIVEDVKSPATRKDKAYLLKNKLMADKFGIKITEV